MRKPKARQLEKTHPIDSGWFFDQLEKHGTSIRQVSKHLGIHPSMLSRAIAGKQAFRQRWLQEFARLIGVPEVDVLAHAGWDATLHDVSADLVAVVAAVKPTGLFSDVVRGRREVAKPRGAPSACVAARIDAPGDYTDGWLVFYVPGGKVEPEAVGRLCVAHVSGEKAPRLCVVMKGEDPGKWRVRNILSAVGAAGSEARLISATPVLWLKT